MSACAVIRLMPEHELVIESGCRGLRPNGRFAALDVELVRCGPSPWIERLACGSRRLSASAGR